ncbi:Uncharacterised protein [Pseudomonas fluorescens]|uniref:Uncharacterized protein n=1 Tax=Pseudomonas fluorescens TaxID=294 RepID=A0A379ILG9_PSEFL|nr:hypothetical protein [Pseudomonas fluorescens]AIG03749.1 hypothetical protein HZ99_16810 [Pseudomonas fluorescens]SUD34578.1 Uncharacterised protein [Pseudomonas fluorescens]
MSETSEDKTKRKYLTVLRDYQWSYQHSIFYKDAEQSHALLGDMVKFKQVLRRRCPDQPFLIRVQALKKGAVHQAFLSIITTAKVEDLEGIANKTFPAAMNVVGRRLSAERLSQQAHVIEEAKPHDLSKLFDKSGINRWSVLNKDKLHSIEGEAFCVQEE